MSLRQAINMKCKECIYDPEVEGGWIQQVHACDLSDCSLWPHRPSPRTAPVLPKMTPNQCHFQSNEVRQGVSP